MSCSVQIKTRNPVKTKKVNNVIHRTTSETIRLGEPDGLLSNSSRQVMTAISPPPLKKSTCSFQITGVSLTQRTDFGDDSADDLDESHTDDISRVTDNETPSFSEDTCSRDAEESYVGSCSALCSVTVIPTSSQYGLAIMPLDSSTGTISENSNLPSKASEATSSELTATDTQSSPTPDMAVTTSARFPGTRFKIVKVETSKPFRRGRWWCMDYLDQSPYTPKNALTYKSPVSPGMFPQLQYTMTATTTQAQPVQVNADSGTNLANSKLVTQLQSTETTVVTQSMSAIALSKMYEQPVGFPGQSLIYQAPSGVLQSEQLTSQTFPVMQTSINQTAIQQNPTVSMQAQLNQIHTIRTEPSQTYRIPIPQIQPYSVPTQQMQTYSTVHITGSIQNQPTQAATVQNLPQTQVSAAESYVVRQNTQLINPPLVNSLVHSSSQPLCTGTITTSPQNYTILQTCVAQQPEKMFITASQPQQRSHPVLLHQPISLQLEQHPSTIPLQHCSMQFQILHAAPMPPVSQPQVQVFSGAAQAQTISNEELPVQNQIKVMQITETTVSDRKEEIDQTVPFNATNVYNVLQNEGTLSTAPADDLRDDHINSKTPSHSSTSKSSPDASVPEIHSAISMLSITPNTLEVECTSPDSVTAILNSLASESSTMDSTSSSMIISTSNALVDLTGAITQVNSVASQTKSTGISGGPVFTAAATSIASTIPVAPAVSATSGVPNVPTVLPQFSIFDDISIMKVSQAIGTLAGITSAEGPHVHAANNTSAIIDTKIEQAMDLVKSHLMYTVREEVEVLKERIAILLDRINQLEMENNFLKANATPEVLTALNNRAPGAQAQGINPSTAGTDGGSPSN